jgi:hypothetical protein
VAAPPRKCFNASRTMHKAARSGSSGSLDPGRPSLWRKLSGFQGILDPAQPVLVYLKEQLWKSLLGFLPFLLRNLKTHARSDEQNWQFSSGRQKIEDISVSPIPPATTHRHCFAQYEPNSYLIEFLRGADCILLRVKRPSGNLFSEKAHAPISQR